MELGKLINFRGDKSRVNFKPSSRLPSGSDVGNIGNCLEVNKCVYYLRKNASISANTGSS